MGFRSNRRASKLDEQITAARMSLGLISDGLVKTDPQEALNRMVKSIAAPAAAMAQNNEADQARARLISARDKYDGPNQEAWAQVLNAVIERALPAPA